MESIIILSFAAVVCFMVYYQMVDYESFYLNHASTSSAQVILFYKIFKKKKNLTFFKLQFFFRFYIILNIDFISLVK
jgi:hypothetical protein